MPSCTICGASISKRNSFAHKGGRACKHHPEAQQSLTQTKAAEMAKPEVVVLGRPSPLLPEDLQQQMVHDRDHCWMCDAWGLSLAEHYLALARGTQRAQEIGEPAMTLFNTKRLIELSGTEGIPRLFHVDVSDREPPLWMRSKGLRELVELTKEALLCDGCIKKYGITEDACLEIRAMKKRAVHAQTA